MHNLCIWSKLCSSLNKVNDSYTPFTRYKNCQTGWTTSLTTGWTTGCIVYRNIQAVVKPVVQPLVRFDNRGWTTAASCKQTFNRLSKRLNNRFDNRLYRVNGLLNRHCFVIWQFKFHTNNTTGIVKSVHFVVTYAASYSIHQAMSLRTCNHLAVLEFIALWICWTCVETHASEMASAYVCRASCLSLPHTRDNFEDS